MVYRYSRWDGSQQVDPFTADDLAEHLAGELLEQQDLRSVLRRLVQRGAQLPGGRRMHGLQDLLERLRSARQQRLTQYNLGSILDDIRERLDRVVETERQGIQRRLQAGPKSQVPGLKSEVPAPDPGPETSDLRPETPEARPQTPDLRKMLEAMARKHLEQLDRLPPDPGGRIQRLREYDFMDPDARRQFQELLDSLQQQVAQSYFQGLRQGIQSMTPEALRQIQQMVRDLNRLLQRRLRGEPTDFEFREFMNKWGQFFPGDLKDVDQLAQHIQQQVAQMESLLNSMSPEQRRELERMLDALFQDGQFQWEMAQLAANLQRLLPRGARPGEFPFSGDEPLTLQEAMRLMGEMSGLDELERELLQAVRANDASAVDADELARLLGAESRQMLEQLQQLTRLLEEAGLIRRKGKDWELTPLAIRKIGQRALQELFARLRMNTFGNHTLERGGVGLERLDETRPYAFGDPFLIDAQRTVMNGLLRQGPGRPIRLRQEDFEVFRTTALTQCSTVILLDMSYSMMLDGRFHAGRKVALALDTLIRSQFPRDTLYVAAFSYFVLPLKPEMLLDSHWIEYGRGTNFQEALRQARLMLSKHKGGTRQILMITDGEPTTYSWGDWRDGADVWAADELSGRALRSRGGWPRGDPEWGYYRPSSGALEETLREVVRCTRDDVKLNIFMLDQDPALSRFVQTMAKLNKGRAFFATPDRLGEYVLLDYVTNKRSHIR